VGQLADRDRLRDLHLALDRRRRLGELAATGLDADRNAPPRPARHLLLLEAGAGSGGDMQFLAAVLGRGHALAIVARGRRPHAGRRCRSRLRRLGRAPLGILAFALGTLALALLGDAGLLGLCADAGFLVETPAFLRLDAFA